MARIVFGTYLFRYPLGGMVANVAGYLAGLTRLGHDVVVVERAVGHDECFDPARSAMTDDPSAGIASVVGVLDRLGLADRWCFVDVDGDCHGLSEVRLHQAFQGADLYLDYGAHGTFAPLSDGAGCRVLIDGEPGMNQIKMERAIAAGEPLAEYDAYYTVGHDVGTPRSSAPTAGRPWRHVFHPVDTVLIGDAGPFPAAAPFTTVMNWQSHAPVEWEGATLGQKDVEFRRFEHLPQLTDVPLELAVSGRQVPREQLAERGWRLRDAHQVSTTYDRFLDYVAASAGEFAVCKQMFVALHTGWFSDRSAAYLAMGRPVVVQDTGWSRHLPTGEGLFAVADVDAAATAIDAVMTDPTRHRRAARELACEHLDSRRVVAGLLAELGL